MRTRTALLLFSSVLVTPVPAQESPPAPRPASAQETRVFDFVAAMVGNKAILASQVTELWRGELKDDEQRPPALRQYTSPAKRHALWGHLLEVLVAGETTAQSARLIGRSPDEIEEQVQRLVQDDIARKAETAGGLNAFARELGAVGQSMGSVAEDSRADILRSLAYYQGVLRELHDQKAMLATPKEMKRLFDADPARFEHPGSVRVATVRFPTERGAAAARARAEALAAEWRALPRPVAEATMRELDARRGADVPQLHVVDVTVDEGIAALKAFAPIGQPGDVDVSQPTVDETWVWVMLCLTRVETKPADFSDPEVQKKLRDEIAARRWQQIAGQLFPENRVGVRRLPWGEPGAMERPRAGAGR